jgi:two-component system OmpR family response regulator
LPRLLLIGEQSILARKLQILLHFEDVEVEVVQVKVSKEALSQYNESAWDLVVIGDTWDSSNVISILIKLRTLDSNVMILTILHSYASKDRVRLFNLGANDVLSQPYHIDELVVRIKNLLHLRTIHQVNGNILEVNELFIDTDSHSVFRQEKEIVLTPTEYDLLLFLAKEAGKAHTRESILNEVWGYEFHGDTNIVDVYIRYLRIKIDQGFKKKIIKTIRGVGYMMAT